MAFILGGGILANTFGKRPVMFFTCPLVILRQQFASQGDVNMDGIIDEKDADLIGEALGSKEGDENWCPDCDLNGDGIIDIYDVTRCAGNQGLTIWQYWIQGISGAPED